ncbi:MAG: 2-isopropylmalate synthase [Helicobacteraceae bacterium]|jgi:2-isopropylmalate synthase|nr:2-isopropylmalate synthase [Helicobacteraceae bacterium]
MQKKCIKIFDTTLRDGEQAPGAAMSIHEKVSAALKIEKLGVDVIEAGFAYASELDFRAVYQIASVVKNATVCALARATKKDIDSAAQALKNAVNPRIHIFLASSDIHLKYKLKISRQEAKEKAIAAVKYAKNLCAETQFSFEDASRSDPRYLIEMTNAVIKAGARIVNLPDTTGFMLPDECAALFRRIVAALDDEAIISAHMHNDLGLATANSLAAIDGGATQIEATINGIGERAGNAALEEIAMIIATKAADRYRARINTKLLSIVSDEISRLTNMQKAPNKAIVGQNAFSHASGIHQDGMLKDTRAYENFSADAVGAQPMRIVLTRHSGSSAVRSVMRECDLEISDFEAFFARYKRFAQEHKVISREMLKQIALTLN